MNLGRNTRKNGVMATKWREKQINKGYIWAFSQKKTCFFQKSVLQFVTNLGIFTLGENDWFSMIFRKEAIS